MNVLDLVAVLTLDSSKYDKGLGDAKNKGNNFASFLGGVGKAGAAAFAAVGSAVTTVSAVLTKETSALAQYGDNIDKMSQKLGISAEAYQEWDAIMQHSGASIDSLGPAIKTLSNAAETGKDSFEKLGISQEQIASMSTEELFGAVITGLQNMEEGTERTYLASQLLGRGAIELGALFNTSAEETQKMKERVHELGGVMSNEAVKSSARFQDSLQDLTTGFNGLKRNMVSNFLPTITDVMDGLTNIFAGDYDKGLEQIEKGIENFVEEMNNKLPKILDIGGKIIGIIGNSILQNLPQLLNMGVDIITRLIAGLIEKMPSLIENMLPAVVGIIMGLVEMLTSEEMLSNIIEAAVKIILALSEGLIDSLPRIMDAMVNIVMNLIQAVINNLPLFVETAIKLMVSLATGIIKYIPEIIKLFTTMGKKVIDSLKNINWIELGKNIIRGIVNGIKNLGGAIGDALMNMARNAWQSVKNFFGIKSPSKLMRDTIGKNIALGMAEGIEDEEDSVYDAMKDLQKGTIGVTDDIFNNIGSQKAHVVGGINYGGLTFNIYGAQGQDVQEIAHAVRDIIVSEEERNKLVYA